MENLLFYILTVVIWGSTWIAIKFQLGTIDPLVSVIYRFTLAATLLMAWCIIKRLNMRFTLRDHGFMALQGTLLFSINYWLFYLAERHITSGLAAVIFSTIVVMNMVNGNLFLKVPFDPKVIAGGTLGLVGIIFVFKPELSSFHLADSGIKGMVLCLIATYCASLGNIISARNQKNGLPIIQSNAYGMAYGTVLMLAVALLISTVWENYHWSHEAFIGVTLILFGNLLMVKKRKKTIRAELLT